MTTREVGCRRVRPRRVLVAGLIITLYAIAPAGPLSAQVSNRQSAAQEALSTAIRAEPSGEAVPLVFFNRPIVVLRATVLGRDPAARVESARRALDDLVDRGSTESIGWRVIGGAALISAASRGIVVLTPPDIDELSGETIEGTAAQAAARMQVAFAEAVESRAPGRLFRASVVSAGVVLLAMLILWGIALAHRAIGGKLVAMAEQTVARSGIADMTSLRASRLLDVERWLITATAVAFDAVVIYATVGFVLRRFPYTRPWGESMRGFLLAMLEHVGLGLAGAIPGLLTAALIFAVARFCARLVGIWFNAVESGRVKPRWIYPETAQPTRRLLIGLVWTFALVVAYPYLPGSQTEAFKGASVFFGLMITFGSSGLVNQIMSGFMITYSRALRIGDFVRVGDVEGSVIQLGVLSTKIRTPWHEEVTIPNAVVVAQTTTDYSRFSDGVFTPTSVTIGYDAPWRQVQSLLVLAAERTPGVRREPKPLVIQSALEDFYVKYTLLICLERQESRPFTLHALNGHIQDLFNEYGVQIMSPNYMMDPAAPKLVPRKDWYAAPARPEGPRVFPTARGT